MYYMHNAYICLYSIIQTEFAQLQYISNVRDATPHVSFFTLNSISSFPFQSRCTNSPLSPSWNHFTISLFHCLPAVLPNPPTTLAPWICLQFCTLAAGHHFHCLQKVAKFCLSPASPRSTIAMAVSKIPSQSLHLLKSTRLISKDRLPRCRK